MVMFSLSTVQAVPVEAAGVPGVGGLQEDEPRGVGQGPVQGLLLHRHRPPGDHRITVQLLFKGECLKNRSMNCFQANKKKFLLNIYFSVVSLIG